MAKDYASLADAARRLVIEYGRNMFVIKFDSTVADSSKPWEGPPNPRAGTVVSTAVPGISIGVGEGIKLGIVVKDSDLSKQTEQILILAPGSELQLNLEDYNEVQDQSTRWRVVWVEKLRPATLTLLYFMGVKR